MPSSTARLINTSKLAALVREIPSTALESNVADDHAGAAMKHATPATLESMTELLSALRAVEGISEKRPGAFSRGSRAFLHFHEDPTGVYADVRLESEFERFRVTTRREQQTLIARVRRVCRQPRGEEAPTRTP
jgi:hypothetical protein